MSHRILYVHHRGELGGAPTSLSYLIGALDRHEFEPHVYCPPGVARALFEEAGAVVHTGPVAGFTHIWASRYEGRRWLLFVRELWRLPGHIRELGRLLRDEQFDLMHLNDSPLIPAAWLARRHRIPVVWHLRSALPEGGHDLRSNFIRAAVRRLSAASIAINEDIASVFDVRSNVIPNPVNLDRFRPGERAAAKRVCDLPLDRPVVAYIGYVYPVKGFREFIRAAARVRDSGLDVTYLVVGGGVRPERFFSSLTGRLLELAGLARNYEREARLLVRELGMEDSLRFIPFTQDPAILYQATDVIVAPSRGPELGRPLIEAAACGIPVVASGSPTGGGIVVNGQTGVLVRDSKIETLADELGSLLRDPERRERLGRAAREHAERHFDQHASARSVQRLYEGLLERSERIPILYVHHRPQLGGAPSSLAALIAELDKRFEPHVFVPEGPAAALFERAGAVVHTGPVAIFAHVWDSPYSGLRWLILSRELATLPGHMLGLERLLRSGRFPIVHLNDSPLLPAAMLAHAHRARVVWHLRSALAGEGRDARSRAILGLMERWGDTTIAIDRDVALRFALRLPLDIVHNSVRFPQFPVDAKTAKARLGLPSDRVVIGFAGFVRHQKGWPELIEAARLLRDDALPVHFVIMGGGIRPPEFFRTFRGRLLSRGSLLSDEESALKARVRELGLEGAFSFLPFTSRTDDVYGALDIVTFPNQGIGLGRPVLEAAAFGKPVVASGSPDGADILVPGMTGLLLDDPTPETLAAALRRLVLDPELRERLGRAAQDHARDHFSAKKNARAVEAIYDRLLAGRPAQPQEARQEYRRPSGQGGGARGRQRARDRLGR